MFSFLHAKGSNYSKDNLNDLGNFSLFDKMEEI
jgi:hypothetical protein